MFLYSYLHGDTTSPA